MTYRFSGKVIIQKLVQQCSFAGLQCAHQCNVDMVVSPIKQVVPCGSCYRVRRHGAQTPPRDKENQTCSSQPSS